MSQKSFSVDAFNHVELKEAALVISRLDHEARALVELAQNENGITNSLYWHRVETALMRAGVLPTTYRQDYGGFEIDEETGCIYARRKGADRVFLTDYIKTPEMRDIVRQGRVENEIMLNTYQHQLNNIKQKLEIFWGSVKNTLKSMGHEAETIDLADFRFFKPRESNKNPILAALEKAAKELEEGMKKQ